MDLVILSRILNSFIFVLSGGYARVLPDALWLLQRLAIIELVIVGAWWALDHDEGLAKLIKLTLWFGVLLWFLRSWKTISDTFLRSLIQVGLNIGGTPMTTAEFLNPSGIMDHGMRVIGIIFTKLTSYSGWGAVFNLPELFLMGLAALAIWVAFFILAAQVFVKVLEFYIAATIAVILLPFGALRYTAFLAERAFAVVIGAGISLAVLALVESLILPVFVALQIGANPSLYDAFTILSVAGLMGVLAWNAPGMAAGIMAGAPALTAATLGQGVVAAGTAMTGSAMMVDRMARTMMEGTRRATAGAAALGTAVREGGAIGMAQLSGRAAADLVGPTVQGYRAAVQRGSQYARGAISGEWTMRAGSGRAASMGAPMWAQRLSRSMPPQARPGGHTHVSLD
jgi:type IV secretion system protein TrbL